MRILYIMPSLSRCNGVSSYVFNYYEKFDHSKIKCDFLIVNNIIDAEYRKQVEKNNDNVILLPKIRIRTLLKDVSKVKKIMQDGKYDIVHSHIGLSSGVYLRIAKRCGIKHRITHSHATNVEKQGVFSKIKDMILKNMVRKYTTDMFACSKMAGKFLFKNRDFTVINNAIKIDNYSFKATVRNNMRKENKIKNDEIIIGHIGRFVAQKNHEFLIDIFNEYHKLNKNSKLFLLGEGPLQKSIRNKVKELSLDNNVIFTGTVNNPEDYYQMFDCFILPSLFEGLPVVGIEAQTAGLQCVFSDEITKEVVVTKNCTFVSLKRTAQDWANTILGIESRMVDRKNTNSEIICGGYSIDNEANKLVNKYEKIISNNKICN